MIKRIRTFFEILFPQRFNIYKRVKRCLLIFFLTYTHISPVNKQQIFKYSVVEYKKHSQIAEKKNKFPLLRL